MVWAVSAPVLLYVVRHGSWKWGRGREQALWITYRGSVGRRISEHCFPVALSNMV